jgi:hypothetical protein
MRKSSCGKRSSLFVLAVSDKKERTLTAENQDDSSENVDDKRILKIKNGVAGFKQEVKRIFGIEEGTGAVVIKHFKPVNYSRNESFHIERTSYSK